MTDFTPESRERLADALRTLFGRHYMPSDEQWDRYAQNLINDGLVADPAIVERVEALADEWEHGQHGRYHTFGDDLRAALTTPTQEAQ